MSQQNKPRKPRNSMSATKPTPPPSPPSIPSPSVHLSPVQSRAAFAAAEGEDAAVLLGKMAALPDSHLLLAGHVEHCLNAIQPLNAAISLIHRLNLGDVNIDVKGGTS